MDMLTLARTAEFLPGTDRPGRRHRPDLTIAEFLQLGLFRVAYLTAAQDEDGMAGVVIHGADGMTVTAVDSEEHAEELAEQLGLVLVAVH